MNLRAVRETGALRAGGPRRWAPARLCAITVAILAVAAPSALASSDAHDGVAAVVTSSGGEIDLFYVAADAGIDRIAYTDASGWGAPSEIPGTAGTASAAPTAVQFGSADDVDLLYRGTSGVLLTLMDTSAGWSVPTPVAGSGLAAGTAPATDVFRSGTELDVWYAGEDGGLYESISHDGLSFTTPGEVAGTAGLLHSGPSADTVSDGTNINIAWQSSDGGLQGIGYQDSTGFAGPDPDVPGTAGTVTGAPSLIPDATGTLVVYPTGGGGLDSIRYDNGWGSVSAVPGTAGSVASAPSGVLFRSGGEDDVFYLSPSSDLQQLTDTAVAGWKGPTNPYSGSDSSGSTGTTGSPTSPGSTAAPPGTSTTPTGSTTTTVTPKPTRRGLHVKLSMYWRWTPTGTRLRRVVVKRLPAAAEIQVACTGHGCPTATVSVGPRGRAGLWHLLEHRRFRAGARLRITFSLQGRRPERVLVQIPADAKPTIRLL